MWAVILLISLFCLLILIICIPIDILISINTWRSQFFKAELKLFYGLIHINLRRSRGQKELKSQAKTTGKAGSRLSTNTIMKIISTRGLPAQVYNFIRNLWRSIKVKTLNINLKIGLEDPVNNGYLFACMVPVNYLVQRIPHDVNIETVFENEFVLDCDAMARIRTYPILMLGCALSFLFSPPVFHIIKILIGDRWSRKSL